MQKIPHYLRRSIAGANRHTEIRAVVVGFEPRGADSVRGQLLVALLSVAGDADRADHLAACVADEHAAALSEDAPFRGAHEVAHEERAFLRSQPHEARGAS